MEMGIAPAYISIGTAAGLKRYIAENGMEQCTERAQKVLTEVCQLPDGELMQRILGNYALILGGGTIADLLKSAQEQKHQSLQNVI